MFEVTKKNCYKCDLETIIDNNSGICLYEKNYYEEEIIRMQHEPIEEISIN